MSVRQTRSQSEIKNEHEALGVEEKEKLYDKEDEELGYAENGKLDSEEDENEKCECKHCGKKFSKKSNLNAHIKTAHLGHRFVCQFDGCDQECTKKASLLRHINRYHSSTNNLLRSRHASRKRVVTIDLTEREYFNETQLTEKAKMAKIRRLEFELKRKDETINELNKEIKNLKKRCSAVK